MVEMCYPKSEGGMEFRGFHSFNFAMLAKQIWRFLTSPDSFCVTILKAKYYPHGDILKARPKTGSSFTWQSLVAAIPTFKRGYIWRVGNGEINNIYSIRGFPLARMGRLLLLEVAGYTLRCPN
jgi:hypothetical protein